VKRLALALALLLAGCPHHEKPVEPPPKHDAGTAIAVTTDDAGLPVLAPAPPLPVVPAGLPTAPDLGDMSPAQVALGELLFYDPRLSVSQKVSCATCHDPAHGFAGGTRQDTAAGKPNLRRAPALANLAWQKELGWDGRYPALADQLAAHLRGQLGADLSAKFAERPLYAAHLARVGNADAVASAMAALVAYCETRYDGDAPWDRIERSPDAAADIKAGYQLFTTKAQCATCHTPPLYTDLGYHRLGLIASHDEGRGRVDSAATGAFKTPTLRGAATRTGFFHDASAPTLDAAIDWHLAGGVGQGADPSIVDLKKVTLSPAERAQLGAFVRALSSSPPAPVKPVLP